MLKDAFFRASAEGWAGGAPKTTLPDFPGSKVITVKMGMTLYQDIYFRYPGSESSFGLTILFVYNLADKVWGPVWHMYYGGQYPERVIDFLKAGLRQAYETKEFVGGRGPRKFRQGNFQYINQPTKNDFDNFKGEERILEKGTQVGFHWYHGGRC